MLAHCRRDQRGLVSAALREVFNAEDHDHARERVGHVLERLAPVAPKVCRFLEEAEEDLIAFYQLPSEHGMHATAWTVAWLRARGRLFLRRGSSASTTNGS
jgi:transposase-like protein